MTPLKVTLLAGALALAGALQAASINPPTVLPQNVPMTSQEKKNLDFVLKWYREVIYAGHLELAPRYQAEITSSTTPTFPPGERHLSNSSKNSAS
jgi:hypothetical protein